MNLSFIKLRVADAAWILIDRVGAEGADPDWSAAARELCSAVRGCGARGLAVLERLSGSYAARVWDRRGLACPLSPSALLCIARWLFDMGQIAGESAQISSREGVHDIVVLDSRNFSISLGTAQVRGEGTRSAVKLGAYSLTLRLIDGPLPPKRSRTADRAGAEPDVEVAVLARETLRIRSYGSDALLAAGAALAAAHKADFAEREASVALGRDQVLVQWLESGEVYVAGAPHYCFRGEFWAEEQSPTEE
jgi:diaminopimelate epimerase